MNITVCQFSVILLEYIYIYIRLGYYFTIFDSKK